MWYIMRKVITSIYIDMNIFDKAKLLHIPISKICNNALRIVVDNITKEKTEPAKADGE
jgi:hypothetical protein